MGKITARVTHVNPYEAELLVVPEGYTADAIILSREIAPEVARRINCAEALVEACESAREYFLSCLADADSAEPREVFLIPLARRRVAQLDAALASWKAREA